MLPTFSVDESILDKLKIQLLSSDRNGGATELPAFFAKSLANRLLLATRWMVESNLCHGREIIDRYKIILHLHKGWEAGLYYMARFVYEILIFHIFKVRSAYQHFQI